MKEEGKGLSQGDQNPTPSQVGVSSTKLAFCFCFWTLSDGVTGPDIVDDSMGLRTW